MVGSPTVDDNNPAVGATFTLSTTVRNDGEGASPATTLRYYRSTDATITTADTAEGTAAVAGLAASGSTSASVQLTAPSTAGTYYYGACVDAVTDESNTANNCSASVQVDVEQLTADLEVGAPTVSDSNPATGQTFTLSATVSNAGDGASAATTLRYYRSTDRTITTSDTSVGTETVGGLAAVAVSVESISLTAPLTAGTYYYGACVDAVTDESNTTNNCSTSVQVTVPAPTPTPATQEFHVWGDSGYTQYLGFFSCVFCTEFDTNSINNEFGPYGNRFSSTSIRNEFSQYGGRFSTNSACNRFASNPPRVFNQSKTVYYGELTLNEFRSDAISDFVDWLEEDVCP